MKQTAEEENVMKKDLRLMKVGAIIVLFIAYIGYILLMVLKKASEIFVVVHFQFLTELSPAEPSLCELGVMWRQRANGRHRHVPLCLRLCRHRLPRCWHLSPQS